MGKVTGSSIPLGSQSYVYWLIRFLALANARDTYIGTPAVQHSSVYSTPSLEEHRLLARKLVTPVDVCSPLLARLPCM